jgi:hypothetical protein
MRVPLSIPRLATALLLPLLVACARDKEAAEACESLMTVLCAAGDDDTCGLGGPTTDACAAWDAGAELEVPALTAEAAEACVELLRAPECDSLSWEAAVADCAQLPGACVQLPEGGGAGDGGGGGGVGGDGWSDSGDGWSDSGDGWDPGDSGRPSDGLDSCDWTDVGICFEFDGYSGAREWCAEVAASYGLASTYYGGEGCPGGGDGPCVYPAGGDFPVSTEAYYYGVDGPQELCEDAGGVWNG